MLEELKIPYVAKFMDLADLKKPPFEKININGRVPAIEDPNTGITLWESGAIIEYLVDRYDTESSLTFTTFPEKYLVKQWLFFQVSGQGPYFGQAAWFSNFHPEKIPSAIKRYQDQTERVVDVLNRHLEGREYLVGDKCTYADLSFVTWDLGVPRILAEVDVKKTYPNYWAWNERVTEREAVDKVLKEKAAKMATAKH